MVGAILAGVFAQCAQARLPEPPNIIYGDATAGVTAVTLKIAGVVITSYTMGSNPKIPSNTYVLVVPLDALDPQTPGTARPGNTAQIYFGNTLAATTTIGARGTVIRIGGNTGNSFLLWTK